MITKEGKLYIKKSGNYIKIQKGWVSGYGTNEEPLISMVINGPNSLNYCRLKEFDRELSRMKLEILKINLKCSQSLREMRKRKNSLADCPVVCPS